MTEDCLGHSRATRQLLDSHKSLTELHLKNLDDKISRVESLIKWAGALIISTMLTVMGWSILQQWNANEAQKNELRQQIQLLQAKQELLESAPRAAEPAGTAVGH